MNNVDEVIQVITIGLVVAGFLLNTNRYLKTIQLCKECLPILNDRAAIVDEKFTKSLYKRIYFTLWEACSILGDNSSAIRYAENILQIHRESGERLEECTLSIDLAGMLLLQRKYAQAKQISGKALLISKEIGHREVEGWCYRNLGAVYLSAGEYEEARKHLHKSLAINKEIGDRNGEASCYAGIGNVYQSVGKYEKAREQLEKSLAINQEIGDKHGEASCYRELGKVYQSLAEYEKAREHLEKSLSINKETGDIHCEHCEANCYITLGNVYRSVGEYEKARDYLEKSLFINKKIGDLHGEASCYASLGNIYRSVDEYEKAREHFHKSLAINKEIGDRNGEASCYAGIGNLYQSLGKYEKAREQLEKSLAINQEIGDKHGEASCYRELGKVYQSLAEYEKAREHLEKSLAINQEIGDKHGEASCYTGLGIVYQLVGEYKKAREHLQKSLAIYKGIGDIHCEHCEANCYITLGNVYRSVGEYEKARDYLEKSLFINKKIGDLHGEASCYASLGNIHRSVDEYEKAREHFQKSLEIGNINKIAANPRTWAGIEGIAEKGCNRTCLYVSYCNCSIYLWIIKGGGVTYLRENKATDIIAQEGLKPDLGKFFDFRSFGILPEELCEDRSLHCFQPESKSHEEGSNKGWRIGNESKDTQGPKMNLPICYKLIIAPVMKVLEGPEIVIVPDRALYSIPFAALTDKSGKYLSETFRIRVVPSLTTLKLIIESPADYHCQTGALIVGNPDVGEVYFKGRPKKITRLPCAEKEARMVGEKLGVEPLLGEQATKQAVLEAMSSVALIHIAAHGDAERGEIALAPSQAFRI